MDRFGFQNVAPGAWVSVDSSWIAAVRWLEPGRLEVRTDRGKVLPYACDEGTFRRMLEAESKGTFLNRVLKTQCEYLG